MDPCYILFQVVFACYGGIFAVWLLMKMRRGENNAAIEQSK